MVTYKYTTTFVTNTHPRMVFPLLQKHMHATTPLIVYTISVAIEFFPNRYSCKVNASLCTKKDALEDQQSALGLKKNCQGVSESKKQDKLYTGCISKKR